jgi:hypothetical protein
MGSAQGIAAAVVVIGVLAAGCGGSNDSGESQPGAAEVTSFEVSDVSCAFAVTAPATVMWATASATAVEIAVDEMSPEGFGPSGTTTLLVPCDEKPHEIAITPESDAGSGETETKSVSGD